MVASVLNAKQLGTKSAVLSVILRVCVCGAYVCFCASDEAEFSRGIFGFGVFKFNSPPPAHSLVEVCSPHGAESARLVPWNPSSVLLYHADHSVRTL